MENRVFLSGYGIINKSGNTLESVKNNPDILGEISEFKLEDFISSQKSYLDRSGELTLAAAQLALNMAKYQPTDEVNWDFGVITGSVYGSTQTLERYTKAVNTKGARGANSILFTHLYMNSPVSILAIDFHLGGHHLCFGGKNAAITAVLSAYDGIIMDRAKDILVVCYDVIPKNYNLHEDILEGATALIFSQNGENALAEVTTESMAKFESKKNSAKASFSIANDFLSPLF